MSYKQWIRRAVDILLSPLHKTAAIQKLDKILLCNIAHFGDVVIAASVISALKEALPHAKIGFLCSSASTCVIQGHPDLEWIHTVDHRRLNRSSAGPVQKISAYYRTKKQALEEIKKIGYDASIDFYPFFPNAAPLVWKAKVPIRIGHVKGGFAPLLTHPIRWNNSQQYCLSQHFELLSQLPITIKKNPYYPLPPKLDFPDLPNDYLLFNMGTAGITKEWPEEHWRELARATTIPVLFTGKGPREKQRIQRVVQGFSHCYDLGDQLSWKELCSVVHQARQIITVDSVIAHLAEAYSVPAILLIVNPSITTPFWIPPNAITFLKPAPSEVFDKIHCLQKGHFG